LRKLPKSAAMIRELNVAAEGKNELLMNYAIASLLVHGDRQWVGSAAARLRQVKDFRDRIWLAANLARTGRYEGWDLVENAIVGGDPWQQSTALYEVTAFRGMRDASGKPVNLIDKLDELMQRAPEERRGVIFEMIIQISEPAEPARPTIKSKQP